MQRDVEPKVASGAGGAIVPPSTPVVSGDYEEPESWQRANAYRVIGHSARQPSIAVSVTGGAFTTVQVFNVNSSSVGNVTWSKDHG